MSWCFEFTVGHSADFGVLRKSLMLHNLLRFQTVTSGRLPQINKASLEPGTRLPTSQATQISDHQRSYFFDRDG